MMTSVFLGIPALEADVLVVLLEYLENLVALRVRLTVRLRVRLRVRARLRVRVRVRVRCCPSRGSNVWVAVLCLGPCLLI